VFRNNIIENRYLRWGLCRNIRKTNRAIFS